VTPLYRVSPIVELGLRLTLVVGFGTMGAQEADKLGRGRPGIPTPVKITIPAFPDGGFIPAKYANTPAGSVSPAIEWSAAPEATVSLALILHDADVPSRVTGSGAAGSGPAVYGSAVYGSDDTLHWAIFNIPATASGLPEGVPHEVMLQDGSIQLKYVGGVPRLAIGKIGYFGPSPPPSPLPVTHHYIFDLYLLDAKLDSTLDSRESLMKAMVGHVLAKGVYFGLYANPVVVR
jgi:Raf kinase inhibitor-like YbhB/YbcL family protein